MTESHPGSHRDVTRWRRLRWAVRVALILGVAASVVANVLHAHQNSIARAIAAWPPLALLITIELVSRIPVDRRGLAAVRVLATGAIAGIAAWVSYWHMAGVAARYGESGVAPYLIPISVDGLIIVASMSLMDLSGRIRAAQGTDPAASDAAPATTTTPVDERAPAAIKDTPESAPECDSIMNPPAVEPTGPRPLDDRERARVLRAVRAYRRSHPDGRPSVGWVRDRARVGGGRVRREDIDAALDALDAESAAQSDPSAPADDPQDGAERLADADGITQATQEVPA